ncbi:MAG: HAMP domain-containing sensor histidine kinase [Tissierellia bacterium]|nr:HAMP domain-containing sensor histidine kinase [Tissierellia bacterium]
MFRKNEYTTLNKMLDDALEGKFREEQFDETELSKFQTRFMRYLTSSSMSERKISEEKGKLKELITDISHQTKTPLTNILLYSQLLEEMATDEKSKEYTREITIHTKKLEDLIEALTKMSRLEGGIFQFHQKRISLSQIVQKVLQQGYSMARCKDITISVGDLLDTKILVDEKWVTEAVYNILDNGIKYSPKSSEIRLDTFCYEMFCGIEIKDQGGGISEEEIPKIFSRFYRGAMANDQEGIGVGLYLSRSIIEEHGGYIKVNSQVGQGSNFQIFFPNLSLLKD